MNAKELDQTWKRFQDNVLYDWFYISVAMLYARVVSVYDNYELCIPIWNPRDEENLNDSWLSFVIEKIHEHASEYPGLDQLSFTFVHGDGSLVRANIKPYSDPDSV